MRKLYLCLIGLLAFSAKAEDKTGKINQTPLAEFTSKSELGMGDIAAQQALSADNTRLRTKLSSVQKSLSDYQEQNGTLQQKISELQDRVEKMEKAEAERELITSSPPPNADVVAYMAGASLASEISHQLDVWSAAGLELSEAAVHSGLTDGLKQKLRLSGDAATAAWQDFRQQIQTNLEKKVKEGEEIIAKKVTGHTIDLNKDGITYRIIRKGKSSPDLASAQTLSLREENQDGKLISQVSSLTLMASDEMPTVVRNALPMLGEGSEVVAYALAKSVYGSLPLPEGVYPFTVLTYRMKGLKAVSPTN